MTDEQRQYGYLVRFANKTDEEQHIFPNLPIMQLLETVAKYVHQQDIWGADWQILSFRLVSKSGEHWVFEENE